MLDLAVRGKLVPQDANDEPASDLLRRIAAEKARLAKAGEIRTPKPIPTLSEPPFAIPSNWRWSQLAEIGLLSPRNEASDALEASFVPMPLIAAEYGVANQHEVRPWGEIKKGYTHFAEGDVGLAKITPCFENGKSAVFRNLTGGIGAGTTELHVVRPLFVDQDYILLFLKSPHFIETGISKMTGTAGQKRVPTEYFAHSPFPLPPLAEQRRIVAKVDELMGLCDRLEAARAGREAVRDRLAAASLARLNAPDPTTFDDDARFALDALPALTTRADQMKALRQTILNLAVRGKLVPQDPRDEPASEFLKRIAAEKKRLGVKRSVAPLGDDEVPFDLPAGWSWTCIGDICSKTGSGSTPRGGKDVYKKSGIPFLRSQNVYNEGLRLDDVAFIDAPTHERMKGTRVLPGDLLLNITGGSMGRCGRVPDGFGDANVSQHVAIIRPAVRGMDAFLHSLVLSPYFQAFIFDEQTGAGRGGLPKNRMDKIAVALPPLAEQRRIVAKVDALMALCDRLEASLASADDTRRCLLEALLAEALTPADARELEAAE
ncbi:MAG: restriction endonuclease subunit S [Pseudorhodoplanes sp.]